MLLSPHDYCDISLTHLMAENRHGFWHLSRRGYLEINGIPRVCIHVINSDYLHSVYSYERIDWLCT